MVMGVNPFISNETFVKEKKTNLLGVPGSLLQQETSFLTPYSSLIHTHIFESVFCEIINIKNTDLSPGLGRFTSYMTEKNYVITAESVI